MKCKLRIITMASIVTLMVGCSSNTENSELENNVSSEVSVEDTKLTEEELWDIHQELMPEMEKIFIKTGTNFRKEIDEYNLNYPDEYTILRYENSSNRNVGEFSQTLYELGFNHETGEARNIGIIMRLNIEDMEYLDKEFKFEDTIFYEVSNLVLGYKADYTEANKQINEMFEKDSFRENIVAEYDNISEVIDVDSNEISYLILID